MGNVKLKGSFDRGDHEMVWFCIRRAASREHSKLATLDFGRADFALFRDLLGRVTWDEALERCLIFKDIQDIHLLQTQ